MDIYNSRRSRDTKVALEKLVDIEVEHEPVTPHQNEEIVRLSLGNVFRSGLRPPRLKVCFFTSVIQTSIDIVYYSSRSLSVLTEIFLNLPMRPAHDPLRLLPWI